MKYISLGSLNKHHIYIILSIICMNLKDIITGYNYNDSFETVISCKNNHGLYNKHNIINYIFCYIGTFFLSLIFYIKETKYYRRKSEKKKNLKEEEEKKLNDKELLEGKIVYLHYESRKNFIYSKNTFYIFLFVILLWIIEEHLIEIFVFLKDLDFWALEIIITSLLNSMMFNIKIYAHHVLVYIINCIPIILKIVPIILSFKDEGNQNYEISGTYYYEYNYTFDNNTDNITKYNIMNIDNMTFYIFYKDKLKNLYVIYWWLVPIGIIIYIFLITLRAYVNSKLKWFMDLKYMSGNKLLMIYGLLGTFLCSIICTITTFVKCEKKENNNKNIFDYICVVDSNNNNDTSIKDNTFNNTTYFDSFTIYFTNFNPWEIIGIIFQIIFFFFNKYFSILIIKFFTPVHLILSVSVYYIFQKIVLIISTLIKSKIRNSFSFFNEDNKFNYRTEKFILDSSGDIISLFGLFIYLEILQLNFCNLNYNLRKAIIKRGSRETFSGGFEEEESKDDNESMDLYSEI